MMSAWCVNVRFFRGIEAGRFGGLRSAWLDFVEFTRDRVVGRVCRGRRLLDCIGVRMGSINQVDVKFLHIVGTGMNLDETNMLQEVILHIVLVPWTKKKKKTKKAYLGGEP